ncbi:MAG: zf-HC2 domain-containing protein [Roseburia sp.]|nr:zf-HC2 domain-containing protein [Roseburia sp.]
MKCDIIKDLLPSYADGLCSEESRKMVEQHLGQCEKCKKYYENMMSDFSKLSEEDDVFVKENLKEKNLLARSEQCIKAMQIKKMIQYINVICIIINVLFIIIGIGFAYHENNPKYPHITLKAQYLPVIFLSLLPCILAMIELWSLKRMKHYIFRIVSSIFLQGLSLVLGFISAICLFVILPPLESMTDVTENYLMVDSETEKFASIYSAVFPNEIPEHASNVKYYYQRKKSFFSEEITIKATWALPVEEYEDTKNKIWNDYYVEEMEKNEWSIIVKGVHYPEQAALNFIYDDNSQTVSYVFKVDKSF